METFPRSDVVSSDAGNLEDDGGGGLSRGDPRATRPDLEPVSAEDMTLPPDQKRHFQSIESSFHLGDSSINQQQQPSQQHEERSSSPTPSQYEQQTQDQHEQDQHYDSEHSHQDAQQYGSSDVQTDGEGHEEEEEEDQQRSKAPKLDDRIVMPPPTKPASEMRKSSPTHAHSNSFISDSESGEEEPLNSPTPKSRSTRNLRKNLGERSQSQRSTNSRQASATTAAIEAGTAEPLTRTVSNSSSVRSIRSISNRRGRPRYLRSNHSQRSSISSQGEIGFDDVEYEELDAQTPRAGQLSRASSLGSIASGVTALMAENQRNGSGAGSGDNTNSKLTKSNEGDMTGFHDLDYISGLSSEEGRASPRTPRASTRTFAGADSAMRPSDTVIATRVGDVQVPPTIARDLRTRFNLPKSPTKKVPNAPPAANSKNMTLKEQSAIIDKMSKENFDLKIKVFYLSDRLDKHSEEGVAEITQENVDLKIRLAELRKSNKSLQKTNKELEDELARQQDEGFEEEIIELREIIHTRETEIVTYQEHIERLEEELRNARSREIKRDSEARMRGQDRLRTSNHSALSVGAAEEEIAILRDMLKQETYKRDQSDQENRRLRDELWHIQNELSSAQAAASGRRGSIASSDRPNTGSSTAVSQSALATVNSRLRHENEDLRQKMAAQTSMLTSRNREKDRLYQEIEELKMHVRNSSGANSRPFSQTTFDRSGSRLSGITSAMSQMQIQTMTESEREDFENMINDLRDKVNELKLRLAETEGSYSQLLQELEVAERAREELELDYEGLRQDGKAIELERNEALQQKDELEQEFENLRQEAEDEIRNLEAIIDDRMADIQHLQEETREREESFEALQGELRQVTDIVVRLEDAQQEHNTTVEQLENRIREQNQIIQESEHELNVLEKNLHESNDKLQRANVQLESAKNEIRFLREEQDGDKIRIGELEREVKRLEMVVSEEKELRKDIERRLDEEQRSREDKWEVREVELEKRLRERERELVEAKNETRHLKKSVHKREDETRIWRERFDSLEKALRDALGGDNISSKSGLIKSVTQHQKELEAASEELNNLRNDLANKTRALKDRENRLESLALEVKRLNEALEKERQGRRIDKQNHEALLNTHQIVSNNLRNAKSTQSELEKARSRDSRTVANLEQTLKDQIAERNNLLTQLWVRLAKICGPEWMSRNSLAITQNGSSITGTKTSMESAVVSAFPSFSQNIHLAVKAMENIFVGWKARMKSVERDLWKEYQIVENALDARSRRLERLEALVRGGIMSGDAGRNEAIAKLRSENRLLKAQIGILENQQHAPDPQTPLGTANGRQVARRRDSNASASMTPYGNNALSGSSGSDAEKRWILRLKELEKRLKKERESRILDRDGAKKRLEEERGEKEQLRMELEREKERMDLQIESGR